MMRIHEGTEKASKKLSARREAKQASEDQILHLPVFFYMRSENVRFKKCICEIYVSKGSVFWVRCFC